MESLLTKSFKNLEELTQKIFKEGTSADGTDGLQDGFSADYYFQRHDYARHNQDYRQAIHDFEHKPVTEEELLNPNPY